MGEGGGRKKERRGKGKGRKEGRVEGEGERVWQKGDRFSHARLCKHLLVISMLK